MSSIALACLVPVGGCYRPNIPNGSLTCGAEKLCPDGYTCNEQGLCTNGPLDLAGSAAAFSGLLGDLDLTGRSGNVYFSVGAGMHAAGYIGIGADATSTEVLPGGKAGFARADQTDGPTVAVFSFANLTIPAGVVLHVSSSGSDAALAIACSGNLTLLGDIDVHAFGGFGGRTGMAGSTRSAPAGSGGGAGTAGTGGGGGGYAASGDVGMGGDAAVGGTGYGSPDLVPLHFGAGGGGALSVSGGNGGGAVALLALGTLTVNGNIDASGDPGRDPDAMKGGGGSGGGSGGSILLSAPSIVFGGTSQLLARGGAGGKGVDAMSDGGAGSAGRIRINGNLTGEPMPMPQDSRDSNSLTDYPTK